MRGCAHFESIWIKFITITKRTGHVIINPIIGWLLLMWSVFIDRPQYMLMFSSSSVTISLYIDWNENLKKKQELELVANWCRIDGALDGGQLEAESAASFCNFVLKMFSFHISTYKTFTIFVTFMTFVTRSPLNSSPDTAHLWNVRLNQRKIVHHRWSISLLVLRCPNICKWTSTQWKNRTQIWIENHFWRRPRVPIRPSI